MTVDDFGNDAAREDNVSVEMSVEGETPVSKSAVGKTPGNVEGETPNLYVEGETPFESEGATPTMFADGEIPGKSEGETPKHNEEDTPKSSKGETPSMFAEGEIPKKFVGDEVPVVTKEQEPRDDGPLEIVDLDDVPEDSPVNLRESRRVA